MFELLHILTPIFCLIGLGYLALSRQLLSVEHVQALGQFVIKIALPSLLFLNLPQQPIQQLWQPSYFIAYSVASLLPFALLLWLYRTCFQRHLAESALYAMGGSMANTGFIGTAVLTLILGAQAAPFIAITFLIENLLIFLLFILCLEVSKQSSQHWPTLLKRSVINIIKNPIIVALCLGCFLSLMQWPLPDVVSATIQPLAHTTAGLGLFVIGAGLYGMRTHFDRSIWKDAAVIALVKLVLMPTLVYILLSTMPNTSPEMIFSGVLLASVSMVTLFGVFGQSLGLQARSAPILMLTTLGSSISMSVVIYVLHP